MKNALLGLALLVAAPAGAWERIEGQHSGIGDFHTAVAQDDASWKALWERHAPGQPVPAVSFDQEQVAAVFLGRTASAGVAVHVSVMTDPLDSASLVIFYRPVKNLRAFAAAVITQPFVIVKTRKTAAVSFESDGVLSIPEQATRPANPPDARRVEALLDNAAQPAFDGR